MHAHTFAAYCRSKSCLKHSGASESVSNPKPKASFTPHGGYTTPEKPESVMEPQTKIPTPRWGCGITAVKAPYEPTKEPRKVSYDQIS